MPVGVADDGRPACVWLSGGFLDEPKLLAMSYDLEQELGSRAMPQFLGSVPPEPPDAGFCTPVAARGAERDVKAMIRGMRARKERPGR